MYNGLCVCVCGGLLGYRCGCVFHISLLVVDLFHKEFSIVYVGMCFVRVCIYSYVYALVVGLFYYELCAEFGPVIDPWV